MIYDIIIVGGGINGILALDYFSKYNILLLEQSSKIISILSNNIYNDLILLTNEYKLHMKDNKVYTKYVQKHFINYIKKYTKNIIYNTKVLEMTNNNNIIEIITNNKKIFTKNIILSIGRYNPRPFNHITKNIVRTTKLYENKTILLIGSGDSAMDFIILNYQDNKILWKCKNKLNIHKELLDEYEKINKTNITIIPQNLVSYNNDEQIFYNNKKLEYDICVCLIGYDIDVKFFNKNSIDLITINNKQYVNVSNNYETNINNVFALGQLVLKPLPNNTISKIERTDIEDTQEILNRISTKIKI